METVHRKYGNDVRFLLAARNVDERVWSSGYKPNHVPSDTSKMPGFNEYGEALTRVFRHRFKNETLPGCLSTPSLPAMLTRDTCPHVEYTRTTLIVSDSSFKYAHLVEGGQVMCRSGACAGDLAIQLRDGNIQLSTFRYVILAFGTNDANLNHCDRESSWNELKSLLEPLRGQQETTVIVNTGIGYPAWSKLAGYTRWFVRQFDDSFGEAKNFILHDWSVPSPNNFFLLPDGRPEVKYLSQFHASNKPDGKHCNAVGLRRLWRHLCTKDHQCAPLRLVRFTTRNTAYTSAD